MGKGRKFLFVLCFIIVDVLLIAGFILMRNVTFKNILENEVISLSQLDFTKDRYNSKVKSRGDYGLVEEAIKVYLDDYALEVQSVLKDREDEKLKQLLTIDNYLNDGPLFEESFSYIDIVRDSFNYDMDLLLNRSYEKEFKEFIYTYIEDEEYVHLYNELLDDNNLIKEIDNNQLLLENKRLEINNYFSNIGDVLEFLKINSSNYKISNNQIKFISEDLEIKYNELVNKTKRIYE